MVKPFPTAVVRITPGHQRRPARLANSDGDVRVMESHALRGETVNVRSGVRSFASVRAHCVPVHIVSSDEKYVGLLHVILDSR
jgi:hypothetical protein